MALTQDRTNPVINPKPGRSAAVAANGSSYAGGLVGANASGYTTKIPGPGVNNSAYRLQGTSHQRWDNTGGANAAFKVRIDKNDIVQGLLNLAGDPVTQADIGNEVYIEDDNTIRRTSNTNTRCGGLRLYRINPDGTVDCTFIAA